MKKNLLALCAALIFVCTAKISFAQMWQNASILSTSNVAQEDKTQNFHDIQKLYTDYWKNHTPSQNEEENFAEGGSEWFKRWEWFMKPRTFPTGELPDPGILFKEFYKEKAKQKALKIHPTVMADNWTFIGPAVVPSNGGGAGRINAVRFHPTQPNTIFACTANGGLWKSTTLGGGWTSTTDAIPDIGVSDIAINPRNTDTIFISTGDRDGYEVGGDFWGGTYSAGVLMSTDAGATWNTTGLSYTQAQANITFRLLINSTNPNVLICSTRSGIYRTTDAGVTWTLVKTGRYYDIEEKIGSPDTYWAASNTQLLESTDAGATWTVKYTGFSGSNRIALTAANPLVIYSLTGSGVCKKSVDGGSTFTTMTPATSVITFQGFYDCAIAVSQTDPNIVVVGGVYCAKSTNGAASWSSMGSFHPDEHEFRFLPGSGTTLFCVGDGGIFKSTNTGSTWTDISAGVNVKQYYSVSASSITPYLMYAGAQDNGTDQLKNSAWKHVGQGCDGMDCLQDWFTDNVAYISCQYGSFYKTTNGGTTFNALTMPASGDWVSPMVMDPLDHNTIYCGLSDLYKSTDAGSSWTALSAGQFAADIIAISVFPADPKYIYANTWGRICRTNTGGGTWTNITAGLPSTGITGVAVSSIDPMKVWVTMSGYTAGNKVYYSSNGGSTWTNISGSLPNVPANCIVYQNNSQDAVYVGTDFGVYYRDASMSDFQSYNTGLPNVMVDDLQIVYGTINKIRAATYGRGLWESDLNYSSFFTLDAGMADVISPSTTPYCDNTFTPKVRIRNYGQTALDSVLINYQIDADPVATYEWYGTLLSGTSVDVTLPNVTSTNGAHTFTVFTSDPNGGTDQNTFNDSRTVNFTINSIAVIMPVIEGFETATFPPVNWTLDDPSGMMLKYATAGGFGNSPSSLKARIYTAINARSWFNSNPVDFTGLLAPASLTFSVAYAMRNTTSHDTLKVFVSTDCGASYTQLYNKSELVLATTTNHSANFTPLASEWRTETIDLTSYIGQAHVQFKFEFYGDAGNNIYVDDINIIDGTIGVHENSFTDLIRVYPNPVSGDVNFYVPVIKDNTTIEIYSLVGNKLKHINVNSTTSTIDLAAYSSGIYFYSIKSGNEILSNGKLIKQ